MIGCISRSQTDDDTFDSLIDGEYAFTPSAEEKLVDDNEMATRLRDLKIQISEAKVDW